MKKIISIGSFLLLILSITVNVNAESIGFNENASLIYFDYREFLDKELKDEIKDPYDTANQNIQIKEIDSNNKVVYETIKFDSDIKSDFRRIGDWYRYENGTWFNYKETLEVGSYVGDKFVNDKIDTVYYYKDNSKCKLENKLINDNCQSKNRQTYVSDTFVGSVKTETIKITYPNHINANKKTFNKLEVYVLDYNDKYKLEFLKLFEINVKRDSNLNIHKAYVDDISNGKVYYRAETGKIDYHYDTKDFLNLQVYDYYIKEYDSKNRISNMTICNYNYEQTEYSYTYHSNNKLKSKVIAKYDDYYNIKKKSTYYYSYKGYKTKTSYEYFKRNKTSFKRIYIYNNKGSLKTIGKSKAYRYSYYYTSKGKLSKRVIHEYNNKGKLVNPKIKKY